MAKSALELAQEEFAKHSAQWHYMGTQIFEEFGVDRELHVYGEPTETGSSLVYLDENGFVSDVHYLDFFGLVTDKRTLNKIYRAKFKWDQRMEDERAERERQARNERARQRRLERKAAQEAG